MGDLSHALFFGRFVTARVAVIAVKPFPYRGADIAIGDVCLVKPIEAAAFVHRRQARFPNDEEAYGAYSRRDETPRRRTYRRRDMVAGE